MSSDPFSDDDLESLSGTRADDIQTDVKDYENLYKRDES